MSQWCRWCMQGSCVGCRGWSMGGLCYTLGWCFLYLQFMPFVVIVFEGFVLVLIGLMDSVHFLLALSVATLICSVCMIQNCLWWYDDLVDFMTKIRSGCMTWQFLGSMELEVRPLLGQWKLQFSILHGFIQQLQFFFNIVDQLGDPEHSV